MQISVLPGPYSNWSIIINMTKIDTLLAIPLLAGVDEVGRGPLAGPVVAAAVILDKAKPIPGLKDSKKLTHKKREQLADSIKQQALAWSLGRAEVEEIDSINILQASLLAMQRAVEALSIAPTCIAVDGLHTPAVNCEAHAVIKGDSLVAAISAASIIAKVARDREMVEMDKHYPGYGFASHKGYPTRLHIDSLSRLGVTPIHRRSFSPVAKYIA